MALPTTRAEFIAYIKRELGHPVITVNVTDEQIDDRVDQALRFWQEYHFEGSEKVFLKHQLTASNIVFSTASTGTFANNELVLGQTSNVYARVYQQSNTTVLQTVYSSSNTSFANGEVIIGQSSGAQGTISAIQLGDCDNQYLPIANDVLAIQHILPYGVGFGGTTVNDFMSYEYQFAVSALGNLGGATGGSLVPYFITKSHMELLYDMFTGTPDLRHNRHVNRLYIDWNWHGDAYPGLYVIVEAIRTLSPTDWPDIWSDRYFADYAVALTKRQWGSNLLKYDGVQMPGGVSLNGQKIYDEGNRQVEALEKDIQLKYELPPNFFVG